MLAAGKALAKTIPEMQHKSAGCRCEVEQCISGSDKHQPCSGFDVLAARTADTGSSFVGKVPARKVPARRTAKSYQMKWMVPRWSLHSVKFTISDWLMEWVQPPDRFLHPFICSLPRCHSSG